MRAEATTVGAYLRDVPAGRRPVLTRLRALVRKSVPWAIESMRYGMPAYTIGNRCFAFASQRRHFALHFCDTDLTARYRARLGKLDCGKSCLRIRRPEEMPFDRIAEMLSELWPASTGSV